MTYRELAKNLIDQISDSKMYYIVAFLQGAAVPEKMPGWGSSNMDDLDGLEDEDGRQFIYGTKELLEDLED